MNNARAIAQAFHAANADRTPEPARAIWSELLDAIMRNAPSGSGIDAGIKLAEDKSSANKLTFEASFHHMSEHGMYGGWTEHTCVVTPTFDGFDVHITGRDRNDIKDYLADVYRYWLTQECEHTFLTAKTALGVR